MLDNQTVETGKVLALVSLRSVPLTLSSRACPKLAPIPDKYMGLFAVV